MADKIEEQNHREYSKNPQQKSNPIEKMNPSYLGHSKHKRKAINQGDFYETNTQYHQT